MQIVSEALTCNDKNGRNIIGFYDHKEGEMADAPFIVIPPSYDGTKQDSLSLSYYLVKNGFRVIRYENTELIDDNKAKNLELTSKMAKDDIVSILDFVENQFGTSQFGILTSNSTSKMPIRDIIGDGRIKFFLNKEFYKEKAIDSKINRRRFLRLDKPLIAKLRIKRGSKDKADFFVREYELIVKNIGIGGAFIETAIFKNELLANIRLVRSTIELLVNLPEHKIEIETKVEIAWIKEEVIFKEGKCEIGMRFVELSDDDRTKISFYISEELEKQREERIASFPTKIDGSVIVKREKNEVYNLLKAMEQFPTFMKNIKNLEVIEQSGNKVITKWEIDVDGLSIVWKEEDSFDEENMMVKFKMIEGDFGAYEGEWKLTELLTGTHLQLEIRIKWGIPALYRYVGPILEEKARNAIKNMLRAIKKRLWIKKTSKLVKFACIIHPLDLELVATFDKDVMSKRKSFIKKTLEWTPPFQCSYITGIRSLTGKEIEGEFIMCPLLPDQMSDLNSGIAVRKVIEAGKLAQKLGAKIVGLGAYAAMIGNRGVDIAKELDVPITTGSTYAISIIIEAISKIARETHISLNKAKVAIVGATNSIGKISTKFFSTHASHLILVAKNREKLKELANFILKSTLVPITIEESLEIEENTLGADIVIVTSYSLGKSLDLRLLKPGTVVYDATYPKVILKENMDSREDILVIDGEVIRPPGDVNFNFYFGLPPGLVYPCLAETMILAFEERYESYSLGKIINSLKLKEISDLASKHGFELAGFTSFGKAIPEGRIAQIEKKLRAFHT